jgi:hypothetical protein
MFTDLKDFNYEAPEMFYDKASGDIKIKEKKQDNKKKLIQNIDDLNKEKTSC